MSVTLFLLVLLFVYLLKDVPKKYKLYKAISSMGGFIPNPSYLIGHAWYLWVGYKSGYVGLQVIKRYFALGKTVPWLDHGYGMMWIGNIVWGIPVAVVTRTEIVKEVFASKRHTNKSSLYSVANVVFGNGLLTSEKDIWVKRRKLLNPTFHQQMLQSYVPPMNEQSSKLVDEIKQDIEKTSSFIVTDITHRLADKIMTMLLLTVIDCDEKEMDPKFMSTAEEGDSYMCNRLANPWKLIPLLYDWTEEGVTFKKQYEFIRREAEKLVEKRIQRFHQTDKESRIEESNYNSNNNKAKIRPALIDAMIEEHRKNPMETTVTDVVDETVTFLLTGWDTTNWTASFSLLMLGLYPEVQEKVYQEIVSTVPNVNEMTMADTMKLKYLECVINETLRFIPLVTFYGRHLESDVDVIIDGKKITFPTGTEVVIESDLLHRNPRYWNDPDRFIPERFLPENSKERDPYAFVPFSVGPRNCIGKTFGMIEDKILLSHLVMAFRIKSLDPFDRIRMDNMGIARRTLDPLRFELIPR